MEKLPQGVFTATKKDKTIYYRASLTHHQKHISLGSYEDVNSAHQAYLEGVSLLRTSENSDGYYTIDDYKKETHFLSFEKWVCLINLRDNRMYFATPIYVRPKFFYYYLSPSTVLKFDIDDLFYFSSHKIMQRGGHYFVADFGMQVNILGRFGIKNYGVCGRDYFFLNDDPTDFRRENLEIFNQYHGVIPLKEKDRTRFRARIHVKGYYLIGTYDTPEEAAIAYNKAIDVLSQNGIRRNYQVNYLENVSPSAYADIYAALKVSPKLYTISPNSL
ncbi:MAG: hypothetical protein IJ282_06415 [Lachnospiraceae bacterium]|nr:hypothetical protein [Lachnospiraceae bacterium]